MPRQLCVAERRSWPYRPWVATFRYAATDVMVSLQHKIGPRLPAGLLEREHSDDHSRGRRRPSFRLRSPRPAAPRSDRLTGILQAFAVFAVGFVARPVGAAIFGHYGDQIGREAALTAESFTPRLRHSGASIGFQLAAVFAGGPHR